MPQRVSDYLDLPASVPKCVIEIRGLDDPESVVANIRDYVLTKRSVGKWWAPEGRMPTRSRPACCSVSSHR